MAWFRRLHPFFVVLLLARAATAHADTGALPEGWRLPAAGETAGAWRAAAAGRYLRAEGDFDGDGHRDEAMVLFADRAGPRGLPAAIGVFAWLSRAGSGDPQVVRIMEYPLPVDFAQIAIETKPPGRYVTACGAGYGDACAPGEPAAFELLTAGIQCCLSESVAGIFWWDPAAQRFEGLPTSD